MQLNAEDGGNRRFIMVQIPEACPNDTEAFKNGSKPSPKSRKSAFGELDMKSFGKCHGD